jgi:hypothetical protein
MVTYLTADKGSVPQIHFAKRKIHLLKFIDDAFETLMDMGYPEAQVRWMVKGGADYLVGIAYVAYKAKFTREDYFEVEKKIKGFPTSNDLFKDGNTVDSRFNIEKCLAEMEAIVGRL